MLFLTNESAKKAEINILTTRYTTGPGYWAGSTMGSHIGVYKAAYITCTSSRLTNKPLFDFS